MLRFRIGSTTVIFSFSFFAIIALLMCIRNEVVVLASLYAAVFHELGHLIAMKLQKIKAVKIIFYGAGVRIKYFSDKHVSFFGEMSVILGGCAMNFIIAGIILLFSVKNIGINEFMEINLIICIFNLMPIKCFDGIRFIRLILERYTVNYKIISRCENIISISFILTILVCAYLFNINNFTLYITLLYFLVMTFLL